MWGWHGFICSFAASGQPLHHGVSLGLKTIQRGGLALQLLLFSFAILQTMWALVVCPHMGAQGWAGLLSPFSSMEAQRGDKNYLKQKERVVTSPEGYMLARTSSGDAPQWEVQKWPPNWRKRRWSLLSPWRGQNTAVPIATSIPCSQRGSPVAPACAGHQAKGFFQGHAEGMGSHHP